jgi:DNA-binding transcriptional LysR family regulator
MATPGKVTMREIENFVVLAGCGSVSKAAERLNCLAKDVTERRQRLEHKLGFKLIRSRGPRIFLTDEAERYLKHAELVHGAFQAGLAAVVEKPYYVEPKKLRLVYAQSPTALFLPEALRKFDESHSSIKIVEDTPWADECVRRVRDDKADLSLTIQPEPPIKEPLYEELVRYRLLCALFEEHKLAKQTAISLKDVKSECLLMMGSDAAQYNRHLRALFEPVGGIGERERCVDFDSQLTKVAADRGVAVVPFPMKRLIGDRPIKLLPLRPDKFIGVGVLWPRQVIPAAKDLVDAARAIIKVHIQKFRKDISPPNPRGGFAK